MGMDAKPQLLKAFIERDTTMIYVAPIDHRHPECHKRVIVTFERCDHFIPWHSFRQRNISFHQPRFMRATKSNPDFSFSFDLKPTVEPFRTNAISQ
jgi:hypothetical protein